MRSSRVFGKSAPTIAALTAALAAGSVARADSWIGGSGTINSQASTRVAVGVTPPSDTQLDVSAVSSPARVALRVNQPSASKNVAEFQTNGSSKVIVSNTGSLVGNNGISGAVSAAANAVTGLVNFSGPGAGVLGSTNGTGQGVTGAGNGTGSTVPFLSTANTGVYGTSNVGYGVYGRITSGTLDTSGVLGYSSATYAPGVMGVYSMGDNGTAGVEGRAIDQNGDWAPFSIGVHGISGGIGVRGESKTSNAGGGHGTAVQGLSDFGVGVWGESFALSGSGTANGNDAVGVKGTSSATSGLAMGVYGQVLANADSSCVGVYGDAQGGASTGVRGESGTGTGVWGGSTTGNAVLGETGSGLGVYGTADNGIGVYGYSNTNAGMIAYSGTSNGIIAQNGVTNMGAAAVSAQPGSTSALAYWGGGGIQLTGSFAEKASGTAWTNPSDRRIKKDVQDLGRGLAELMRVRPVTYKFNGLGGTEEDGKEHVGVIAQELEKVLPSMIASKKVKLHKDDAKETEIELVDASEFTFLLINAVKEQQRTIQKQEDRIGELERRQAPVVSSLFTGGLGAAMGLFMLPVGLLVARRRRKDAAQ